MVSSLASQSDDRQSFADLIAPHRELIRATCFRICANRADAEDAIQLTLVAAWRGMGSFDGRSRLSTWLCRIAYNSSLGVLRSNRRHASVSPVAAEIPDVSGGDFAAAVESRELLHAALIKIPVDFRTALVLRDLCGCSYQEVAEIQGVKIETAKTRIARGRQALAALLGEAVGGEG
jgi:RNA polymerase sigma-70 factor, ECF subfamily